MAGGSRAQAPTLFGWQWPAQLEHAGLDNLTPISIDKLQFEGRLGTGASANVYRARYKDTTEQQQQQQQQQVVAVKHYAYSDALSSKYHREGGQSVPVPVAREIAVLRSVQHENVVQAFDVAVGGRSGNGSGSESGVGGVYLVMELAELDIARLMDEGGVRFGLGQVKCLFRQLLKGLGYLHARNIIHRDIKIENLLLTKSGTLKIVDFGTAQILIDTTPRTDTRELPKSAPQLSSRKEPPEKKSPPLTPRVTTIWYAAPEMLLASPNYSAAVDMWSAGTVLGELLLSEPLLPGDDPFEQLSLIARNVGAPTEQDFGVLRLMGCSGSECGESWAEVGGMTGEARLLDRKFEVLGKGREGTVEYLKGLLRWNPEARWSARQALGGLGRDIPNTAQDWWEASPRACGKESLAVFLG